MRSIHYVVAGCVIATTTLIAAGIAQADDYVGDSPCDSSDYSTSGHNDDRTDDGCDTKRYENRGENGGSAPQSLDYGHAHGRDDTPVVQGLLDAP
jgi:hypothetical protein